MMCTHTVLHVAAISTGCCELYIVRLNKQGQLACNLGVQSLYVSKTWFEHVWMCRAFGSVSNGASLSGHETDYWRKFKTAVEAAKQRRASKAALTNMYCCWLQNFEDWSLAKRLPCNM